MIARIDRENSAEIREVVVTALERVSDSIETKENDYVNSETASRICNDPIDELSIS